MRLTSSRAYTRATAVPKMPPGLVELMEGLTKDVLKNNPTNIYEFCANHLEKLLEIRDGPTAKKTLTLEEKISKAQETVRQRAKKRQDRFDNELQSDIKHDATENDDSSKEVQSSSRQELVPNLRAPVHHDQDLSLSSEVEISHEPTDNSLTSKDSHFDEFDEISISKSSTFSSVSKSTVIDLGNDYDPNNKEEINDGVEVDNTHEPVKGNEKDDDQKDETVTDKKIEPSSDNSGKTQENIQSSFINNSNQQVTKEESGIIIPDEDNILKEFYNTMADKKDSQSDTNHASILLKSDSESERKNNLKSLEEVNVIIEEDENQIELSQDTTTIKHASNISVEDKIDAEALNMNIKNDNFSDGNANETTDIVNEEKSVIVQGNEIAVTNIENVDELLKETSLPLTVKTNIITDIENSADNLKDSESNEGSVKVIEETNHEHIHLLQMGEKESQMKVIDENIVPIPDSIVQINTDNETGGKSAAADEKIEIIQNSVKNNTTEHSTSNMLNLKENEDNEQNLEEKTAECRENVNENYAKNTNSTSVARSGTFENNDDSSVFGSDLSKAEDDIPLSDNENGHNDMDLETAAVTIQKVFRSFLFKSRNSTFEDITNDEATSLEEDNDKKEDYYAAANLSKERRPLGITRMDTVLQTVNEEKSLSLSTDDSSTLSSAATTIQAHVRGFLVRNKLNSYKTASTNSLVNSNEMDTDTEQRKNKTVLNIHIVPEEGNYLSRDESLITSMDLSLDGSPQSSVNLHPLSYDLVSERRKLLKREDAIQSVSPPSNNSGKLSEESVKEVLLNENDISKTENIINEKEDQHNHEDNSSETLVVPVPVRDTSNEHVTTEKADRSVSSDESDVITPFVASPRSLVGDFENTSKLLHSGEFHDVVLPTKVSRSETTVVREFKNVLAYILLWNNS